MRFADGEPHQGDRDHHQPHLPRFVLPRDEHEGADRRAKHDRHEGSHFEQGVGAREILVAQHFGHDAVFGGAENGGMERHQEQHHQHQLDARREEHRQAEQHDRDFENLHRDQHRALADGVRQVARISAEKQERKHENGARQRQVFAARPAATCTARMETTIL
jgi:hypothetical protein